MKVDLFLWFIWNEAIDYFLHFLFPYNYTLILYTKGIGVIILAKRIIDENRLFAEFKNKTVLLVLESSQLNILGQTFRPIFTGEVTEVNNGFITMAKPIIKMHNAPFYQFPTPLNFPIEHIVNITLFDPKRVIPIV